MIPVMVGYAQGFWPPNFGGEGVVAIVTPTPRAPHFAGLLAEKAGEPRQEGEQWIVPVKVTNRVEQSPAVRGTPTPNAPTPQPEQARVINGSVKVLFYNAEHEIVGGGNGNVLDLAYGESKNIEVVATAVGEFTDYVVFADSVWTDKDVIPTPEGSPAPNNPSSTPNP
jgi:hypothetical protein